MKTAISLERELDLEGPAGDSFQHIFNFMGHLSREANRDDILRDFSRFGNPMGFHLGSK